MANRIYVVLLLALLSTSVFGAEPHAEGLLFRKEIAPETFIIVKRSAFDSSLMESIAPFVVQDRGRLASISVEVHRNGKQAVLGASVVAEFDDFRNGFHVLDVASAEGDIVVACSVYDLVGFWRISANIGLSPKPSGWTLIAPSRLATRTPLKPGEVEVSLIPPKDGLWSAKVTDKRVAGSPTTIFKQSHGAWTFAGTDAGK